jgi:DNA processing protein
MNREVTPISAEERRDRLRLIRSENVGPITFYQLLSKFGSATEALAALPELARRGGQTRPIKICPASAATREIEALGKIGARLIAWGEEDYPEMLAALDDAPPTLSVRGNGHLLGRRTVAIVGARNASANGRRMAEILAADTGRHEIVIASGMARGIDAMAHAGALESGTVAVMAGGVDVVYPAQNAALYEEIVERGAVISEHPPGLTPKARHFPYRNRLISGLSLGVVVIEATFKSGSLITARFAGDQGREVMAVPGSPLDPRAKGSNQLIRDGATLVQTANDVIEAISGAFPPGASEDRESAFAPASTPVQPSDSELSAARADIAEKLGPDPVTVDEIIRQCQLSPAVVSTVLLEMELAGRLERHPGNQVALRYD